MINFKNNLILSAVFSFTFALFMCLPTTAFSQAGGYRVPPVQLTSLKKIEANAYGLEVGRSQDVINAKVWHNTSYPVVAGKFSEIPLVLPPVAQTLFLDLIRMSAEPPQGTTGEAFIDLKLNLLFQRGRFEEVYRLVQRIPEQTRSLKIEKIYAEVLLLQDLQTACYLGKKTDGDDFWLKMTTACDAFHLEESKAQLGLSLLKEQKKDDAFLTAVVDFFLYKKPLEVQPKTITPLNVALWKKAGKSLNDLTLKPQTIWFKKIFVIDEEIDAKYRVKTVEELVEIGLLSPLFLRMVYQQVEFGENPTFTRLSGAEKRAFFVQSAAALSRAPFDNLKKQAFLKQGLESAKKDNVLFAFSNGSKDVLETLRADLDTLADSALFIEAFSLSGLSELAIEWYKKAKMLFPISQTAADSWPFVALLEKDEKDNLFLLMIESSKAYFDETHAQFETESDENLKRSLEIFYSKIDKTMLMFEMLGMISSEEAWQYTTFPEGSALAFMSSRRKMPKALYQESVGIRILNAIRDASRGYTDLLIAFSTLSELRLEQQAKILAIQSMKKVLEVKEVPQDE